MCSYFSRMSSRSLAEFLLTHADRNTIISELACLYSFTDIIEEEEKSEHLSELIREFECSGCSDADLLTEIIEQRRRRMITRQKRDNLLLNQIYQYIGEHLTDDLKMEELAESLHVNFNYLCRFFKHQTGMSLNTYKTRKRIEKSLPLLTQTEQPVTEIAHLCGFENSSYFTKQFAKVIGMTPTAFRLNHSQSLFAENFVLSDTLLAVKLELVSFLADTVELLPQNCLQKRVVSELQESNSNLAVPCITAHQDTLYTLWAMHYTQMPRGLSVIQGKFSRDEGETWQPLPNLVDDCSGRTHYGPTMFGTCGGELYLLQYHWVEDPSQQSLEILKLDAETGGFLPYRSLPVCLYPSAKLQRMPNGTLLLAGRTNLGTLYDGTPAVLIFEDGTLDGDWRLVPVMENNRLPDGSRLICPHSDLLYCEDTLWLFCRNDRRRVPLVFASHDFGQTWSEVMRCDLPYEKSGKFCSGTLSTGENYLIVNTGAHEKQYDHTKLTVYFSRKNTMVFDRALVLYDSSQPEFLSMDYSNQPSAVEHNGKLHVITVICDETAGAMGTLLYTIDLSVLQSDSD